jgi:hypothetical protein
MAFISGFARADIGETRNEALAALIGGLFRYRVLPPSTSQSNESCVGLTRTVLVQLRASFEPCHRSGRRIRTGGLQCPALRGATSHGGAVRVSGPFDLASGQFRGRTTVNKSHKESFGRGVLLLEAVHLRLVRLGSRNAALSRNIVNRKRFVLCSLLNPDIARCSDLAAKVPTIEAAASFDYTRRPFGAASAGRQTILRKPSFTDCLIKADRAHYDRQNSHERPT